MLKTRSSAAAPPEKSTVPVPEIAPPPLVVPARRRKISRDPLNRPSACSCSISVPVTGLSRRALLRSDRAADGRVDQPPADVGADRDRAGQVEDFRSRQAPERVGRAGVAKLGEQGRVEQLGHEIAAADRREARLRPADGLPAADRDGAHRGLVPCDDRGETDVDRLRREDQASAAQAADLEVGAAAAIALPGIVEAAASRRR